MKIAFIIPLLASLTVLLPPALGKELYFTDFEEFTAGTNNWVGSNGWLGLNADGVSGIDDDALIGLGQTAFLGFREPSSTAVTVFRPLMHDHVGENTATVIIDALIGIQDSTNLRKDSFLLSIFNNLGTRIAALQFDNTDALFGIWRREGSTSRFDTGEEFIRNDLRPIRMEINLTNNTWTASYDAIPLFTDEVFNNTGQAVELGFFGLQWDLTALGTAGFGNNWLLVADLSITAVPDGQDPFVIATIPGTPPSINWLGEIGFDYQVVHSDDSITWTNTLPNSFFNGFTTAENQRFLDTTIPIPSNRLYRVMRSATP